jgi:hypothetical protein
MRQSINIQRLICIALCIAAFAPSCKKFEDVGSPPNQLTADKVYSDSTSIVGASLALYGNFAMNGTSGFIVNTNKYGSISADDAYKLIPNGTFDTFQSNTLIAGDLSNDTYYNNYAMIFYANNILQNLGTTTAISNGLKNQLAGEAKFWRAYLYFYLVNNFGDVPLVTTTDAVQNAKLPRTPKAQVYQQIITDLTDAKSLLTDTYPSAEKARINREAVSALLSRVYLYLPTPDFSASEKEATAVINSNIYSLDALSNVFLKSSKETIWQVQSNSGSVSGVTRTGIAFLPSGSTPDFVLYSALAKAFEPNDQRKTTWAGSLVYNGTTYLYPAKYKNRNTSTNGNEYSVMLRLAEVYLNRAESRAQQGNISGAQADLNMVRGRAGLPNTTAAAKAPLLTAIAQERWVELFTENSDRWFNLKRTGTIGAVLPVTKSLDIPNYSWKPNQALYPIPSTEILANPNLTQNPGY